MMIAIEEQQHNSVLLLTHSKDRSNEPFFLLGIFRTAVLKSDPANFGAKNRKKEKIAAAAERAKQILQIARIKAVTF